MKITPYLIFNGQAEEAANFYTECLGGKIGILHRYESVPSSAGLAEVPEEYKNRVLHCSITFPGGSMSIADTVTSEQMDFGNGGNVLTLNCDTVEQIEAVYAKLCDGAQKVPCELCEAYFAKCYAEIVDRYGVSWALLLE